MRRLQREQNPLLVEDREPVGNAEQVVNRLDAFRQVVDLALVIQRVAFAADPVSEFLGIRTEFAASPEDQLMLIGDRRTTRIVFVLRKPPGLQRLEFLVGLAVGSVTGTDDVINEITLVIHQHLLAGGGVLRKAFHNVVMVKTDDLTGTAQVVGKFPIPDCQQDVTVRADEDADLRVLQITGGAIVFDVFQPVRARQRQVKNLYGLLAERVEFPDRCFGREIADIEFPRHR